MDSMYLGVQAHAAKIVEKARQMADTEPDSDIAPYARIVQIDAGTIAESRKADSEILFKTAELVKTAGKMTAEGPANSGTLESIGTIQRHAGEIVSRMGTIAKIREGWRTEREEEGSDE